MAKTNLNLEVSAKVKQRLLAVQERVGAASMTEVFRRALATYDTLTKYAEEGYQVELHPGDGGEGRIKILLLEGEGE